jgi:hypothetical protein
MENNPNVPNHQSAYIGKSPKVMAVFQNWIHWIPGSWSHGHGL